MPVSQTWQVYETCQVYIGRLFMAQEITPILITDLTEAVAGGGGRWRWPPMLLLLPSVLVTLLFLFYPLAFIILMSFTEKDSFLTTAGSTYTWQNYADMVSRYGPNVSITLQLAGLATLVDLIFGFPFAYILVRKVRYRDIVRGFMVFPMFGALYIAFGMRFILLPGGGLSPLLEAIGVQGVQLLYGMPSVVFAMAIFTFPFMVMNIGAALSNVDPVLEETSVCLGAKPWQTFWRVILPLTRSGVIAGMLMCFGWNIGAFAEPLLLGTLNEQRTLAWTLYQRGVVQLDYGLATAMGVILMIIAFTVNYASLRYSRGALVQ
jgi:ABC-type spermidine/putrescine transport system permease subunit I